MSGHGLDLILRRARLVGHEDSVVDIGIRGGTIVEIAAQIAADGPEEDLGGRLVLPGFVESHIHLDKSRMLDRCDQTDSLADAIASVSAAKDKFTVEDVYARSQVTIEKAILHGTTRMRTHVEIDPRIGLRGFEAVRQIKKDYAHAVDLQICVFPQEGLLNNPGTEELLVEAIEAGADLIGGCPYTDSDPNGQIARLFELAQRYDLDIDLHLDFHLDPDNMDLGEVCRQTEAYQRGGRVAVGHVTGLSAMTGDQVEAWANRMANAGVALTVLPATDLFLMGREHDHSVPRGVAPAHRFADHGVTCSLATNNVLNPFTPFGDCSLLRMANLFANIAQIGGEKGLERCLEMVTADPARLMNLTDYGLAVGNPADVVVMDAYKAVPALSELALPLYGWKNGRRSFTRPPAILHDRAD